MHLDMEMEIKAMRDYKTMFKRIDAMATASMCVDYKDFKCYQIRAWSKKDIAVRGMTRVNLAAPSAFILTIVIILFIIIIIITIIIIIIIIDSSNTTNNCSSSWRWCNSSSVAPPLPPLPPPS